jgi:hypothetical protein
MMNKLVLALLLVMTGCAGHKPSETKRGSSRQKFNRPAPLKKNVFVWEILSDSDVVLKIRNVVNRKRLTLKLSPKNPTADLEVGYWQVEGFSLNGVTYSTPKGDLNFTFSSPQNSNVYAGTLIFGCPKVGSSFFSALKKMKYFSRYEMRSGKQSCEMIVGNDFDAVAKRNPDLRLIIGI